MTYQEYLDIINQEPSSDMICESRDKNGDLQYRYIRKSVLQRELLRVYQGNTRWEMLRDTISKNGIWGVGKLEVKHPVSGEWLTYTGVASLPHERRMRLNYPKLEAHCMINACKKIGAWFGQTINIEEEDDMDDTESEELEIINVADERLEILIEEAETLEQLATYKKDLPPSLKKKYMEKVKTFIK